MDPSPGWPAPKRRRLEDEQNTTFSRLGNEGQYQQVISNRSNSQFSDNLMLPSIHSHMANLFPSPVQPEIPTAYQPAPQDVVFHSDFQPLPIDLSAAFSWQQTNYAPGPAMCLGQNLPASFPATPQYWQASQNPDTMVTGLQHYDVQGVQDYSFQPDHHTLSDEVTNFTWEESSKSPNCEYETGDIDQGKEIVCFGMVCSRKLIRNPLIIC